MKLDFETVRKDVAEIIKGREDYVYVNPKDQVADGIVDCSYFDMDKNEPSCIVGHVLYQHGVKATDLRTHKASADYNGENVRNLFNWLKIDIDQTTQDYLERLQEQQDNGLPWGKACEYAESYNYNDDEV